MTDPGIGPSDIFGHMGTTLLSFVIGVIVGGLLGVATGFGLRALYSLAPGLRLVSILLPWRTALAVCLSVSTTLILSVIMFRLGAQGATTVVGVSLTSSLLFWTMLSSVLIEARFPSSQAVRVLGAVRTTAVLTVVIALAIGQFGISGTDLGALLYRNVMTMAEFGAIYQVVLVIALLALVLDLSLGAFQLIAAMVNRRSGQESTAD